MQYPVTSDDRTGLEDLCLFIKKRTDNSSDKHSVQSLYDNLAPTLDKGMQKIKYKGPEKIVALLRKYCPDTNIDILECGAGTGLVGEKLHAEGYNNIVGIDISQKSVEIAEQKHVYRKLICTGCGGQNMPFSDNQFEVLICCGCIIPAHISPKCFQEWTRVVKPGGHVIIVMRRCYIELQKDEEAYYSRNLGELFNRETCNLEDSGTWKVILRETFPGYCYDKGTVSDGLAVVCKIL